MYANGEGVPEDDAKAVYWWRKAAEQGVADAQTNLGLMHANGEGVPEDDVQAYAWFSIAVAQGYEEAKKNKDIVKKEMTRVKKEMTREQFAEAQKLSSEYWKKYVVPFQKN